jgi:hypothetical protein
MSLPHKFLMTGDFSIHFEETGDSHPQQFMTLDSMAIVKHHPSVPTRYHHPHSLDVVIIVAKSPPRRVISDGMLSPSDHCHILSVLNMFFNSLV